MRGLIDRIQPQPEHIFEHSGNKSFKHRTAKFKTRIGVNLEQPWLKPTIDNEIQAKELKCISNLLGPNPGAYGPNRMPSQLFHLGIKPIDLEPILLVVGIQIPLKLPVTDLIPGLKPAILVPIGLNRVIGEVNE